MTKSYLYFNEIHAEALSNLTVHQSSTDVWVPKKPSSSVVVPLSDASAVVNAASKQKITAHSNITHGGFHVTFDFSLPSNLVTGIEASYTFRFESTWAGDLLNSLEIDSRRGPLLYELTLPAVGTVVAQAITLLGDEADPSFLSAKFLQFSLVALVRIIFPAKPVVSITVKVGSGAPWPMDSNEEAVVTANLSVVANDILLVRSEHEPPKVLDPITVGEGLAHLVTVKPSGLPESVEERTSNSPNAGECSSDWEAV